MLANLTVEKRQAPDRKAWELLLLADESKQAINRYIGECQIYMLQHDSESVGICAFSKLSADIVEIKNFAIQAGHQCKGLGTRFLREIEKIVSIDGYKIILVGTGDASHGAMVFYQKNGYEFFQIRHNFFLENYSNPIIEQGIQLKHMIVLKKNLTHRA